MSVSFKPSEIPVQTVEQRLDDLDTLILQHDFTLLEIQQGISNAKGGDEV